jgi:hypothetical protein
MDLESHCVERNEFVIYPPQTPENGPTTHPALPDGPRVKRGNVWKRPPHPPSTLTSTPEACVLLQAPSFFTITNYGSVTICAMTVTACRYEPYPVSHLQKLCMEMWFILTNKSEKMCFLRSNWIKYTWGHVSEWTLFITIMWIRLCPQRMEMMIHP